MSSTATTAALPARSGVDRRRAGTKMFSRYWLRGRRRGGRREGERHGIYVDRYTTGEASLFLGVVLLSVCDLLLTLLHLSDGGGEANPLMAVLLAGGGALGFTAAKLAATFLGALVLLVHVRFPFVRRAFHVLCGMYLCLMLWHGVVVLDRISH